MSSGRKLLSNLYLALAGIALIGTWRQNIAFMNESGIALPDGFVQFWPALFANRATISITVDIFIVALVASIWMVLEGRRLQLRFPWLYVLFGILIAISVTFPLFLFARERRLAERDAAATEPKPTGLDKALLALLTAAIIAFTAWCTLR